MILRIQTRSGPVEIEGRDEVVAKCERCLLLREVVRELVGRGRQGEGVSTRERGDGKKEFVAAASMGQRLVVSCTKNGDGWTVVVEGDGRRKVERGECWK